jgi:YVTN family beta-propeller protein
VSAGPELPRGTVTFLFTDIEGSTRLLKQLRDRYGEALAEHQRILRAAFDQHGGREIDTQGDSFFIAFPRAKDAVAAAVAGQRALGEHSWPEGAELRVRMGLHTGEPTLGGERYLGLGVHRAARISAAGHGGQVLVSQTTRELLRDDPLPAVSLRDLGEHQLKDLDEPERIYQLAAPGLAQDFPPLKTSAPSFTGPEGALVEAAEGVVEELAGPWRPDRRLAAAAAALAVAGAVAAGVLLTRGGTSSASASSVAANAVGVIDAKSGDIKAQIPVGAAPGGVAVADDGSIWIANSDSDSVSKIDPETNDVRQTLQVGDGPTGVAVTGDRAWVANGLGGTVSAIAIDASNEDRIADTITVGNGPAGIASGEGAVWVANSADGTVSRLNPESGKVTRTSPAVIGATGVAVGFHRVWVVSPSVGTVVALHPKTGEVQDRIGVGVDAAAVAAGAGAVWVANRGEGSVSKINPDADTPAVIDTIQVGRSPDAIAAGPDGVWVANRADGTLSRIDPVSDFVVETVRLANPPQGVAVSSQRVYVAVRSTGREHRGGTLRVNSNNGPDFIDTALSYTREGWSMLSLTNDGLVGFRRVGGIQGVQLVPNLAISIPTPTDEARTYTFRLRPDIHYSDGRLVTPADFRRAIERVFEVRPPPSAGRQFYASIVGAKRCQSTKRCDLSQGIVTDRDARTVTFHLTAPDAEFLSELALSFAVAVPAGTPSKVVTKPLPATGPYLIKDYKKNGFARLVRNKAFRQWSEDAQPDGYPDEILWRFSRDTAARVRKVETKAADVAWSLVPPLSKAQLDRVARKYLSQLHMTPASVTNYFFLNTRVPPFDNMDVRRAVNYAFDREEFAKLLGRGFAPTCQILPPNYPSYHRVCPYPGGIGSLDKARGLVQRSGTTGMLVTVWVPAPIAVQGRFLASVLRSLGYRARVKTVADIFAYFNRILDSRLRVQAGYTGWGPDFPSAVNFFQPQFVCAAFVPASPQESSDPSEFCNRAVDRQIARAAAVQAQNPAAAIALWQKVEETILDQAPIVPTYNRQNVDFIAERVGNYRYHPQWGVLLDQLWIK